MSKRKSSAKKREREVLVWNPSLRSFCLVDGGKNDKPVKVRQGDEMTWCSRKGGYEYQGILHHSTKRGTAVMVADGVEIVIDSTKLGTLFMVGHVEMFADYEEEETDGHESARRACA